MRKFLAAAVAGILIGWMGSAFAVIGTATVAVTDGRNEIPNATVSITFKTETGRKIRTVRRRTPRSGRVTVTIPDRTATIEVTAVAPACQRGRETTSGGLFGWNVSVSLRCGASRTGRVNRSGVPAAAPEQPVDIGGGD